MMDAKRAQQEGRFGKKAEQKYHWAKPQKREMPKERRESAEISGEEKERFGSFHWPNPSLPPRRPLLFNPKPGQREQRHEKVEFPFTLADRNWNLSSPLSTKDLQPLMS